MPNVLFFPFHGASTKGVTRLYAEYQLGASGAIASTVLAHGIRSIVRNSAGNYTVTLDTNVRNIFEVIVETAGAAVAAGKARSWQIIAESNGTGSAAPTVNFVGLNGDTPADPENNAILKIAIYVQKL